MLLLYSIASPVTIILLSCPIISETSLMSELSNVGTEILALLQRTLSHFVAADAQITQVSLLPISAGLSGAEVRRYIVSYATRGGEEQTQLVTKRVGRREWRALHHLNRQQQPNVPFAYANENPEVGGTATNMLLLCMQDVGSIYRPTSLEPITEEEFRREAEGIAAIHHANFDHQPLLAWLPRVDRLYIKEMLDRRWRPHWEKARVDQDFFRTFRAEIPLVEAAAEGIEVEMALLMDDVESQTLIHSDLHPSNVLVQEGKPYFIDWQVPMVGPFYMDVPHHHCTLAQAEHYRRALLARGHVISHADFAERYRIAARYIGLRYMWWTLDYWLGDHSQDAWRWVQHYIGRVRGDL